MDKSSAREEIKLLIEKYNKLIQTRRDIRSKEEELTKKDLILPLFRRVLGWNTEDSKEVTGEEKISKGWVDYGFRINGVPKFFLEAKALSENLDDEKYFRQAVNYAYYKRCPWAVLTNFETVKILNAEWEAPNYLYSHFMTIKCNEFLDRFDDLWLLSKEGFEQGSLDKLAERYGKKTKKTTVDKQLLDDFTKFRDMLSKNVTKLNPEKKLTQTELDESIQRILDRLIFIRNCEDRGLEEKRLWEARNETKVWKKLKEVFAYYDKNYDSKLFTYPTDAKKVHLCDTLDIDDSILREIIECLYRTNDQSISYDFSIIDADVLGTVYEQYLSHILKKTEKRATLTENHTHKKEQGIYYTPTYIVDYIVRSTLGELLKNENIDAERIKVLDPACGSGSFLIKAFDVLTEHYHKNDKDYSQTQLDLETGTTFTRKVKILQNNIFGVDLDKQAVEITQLNLLLKIAEKGHRLPLLEQNMRCGNSLIDDEKLAGDKAFKWEEQFKEIMKEGGFDVVIGNPPYVRQEELSEIKPYLEANYETYQGTADLFVYFFEKELKILKEDGYFGMIVSNKWLRAGYGKNLRKFLAEFWIEELIDFGDLKVFADATIYPCIIIIKKIKKHNPKIRICKMETLEFGSLEVYMKNNSFFINQSDLSEKEWNIQKREGNELLRKIRSSGLPLEEYVGAKIYRGILTGLNEAFIIDEKKREELIRYDSKNEDLIKSFLTGAECKRYVVKSKKNYIILTKIGVEVEKYPAIYKHLCNFRGALEKRWDKGNYWYELRACAYYDLFGVPKIVWGNLATRSSFSLDETNGFYVNAPACILPTNSRYVLGILNSKLMSYFLKSICAERQGGFIEQKPVYVSQVPIKKPTKEQEIEITQYVEKILQLNEKLLKIGDKLTDERAVIEDEIKKTDSEIDELVYKIYGLTEDEKAIVESSLK
jgi:type I restriction-modification system DNA methylase subunit